MANDLTMKMNLIELYGLIGDDHGISFYYDDLPGVVVTIGFTKEEDNDGKYDDDASDDGEADDGRNGNSGNSGKGSLH